MGTFGERYRQAWALWRKRHPGAGENETAFAAECGIPMSTASPYKNQIEAPIHARVLAIAKEAGVDPGWLAYGEMSAAPAPSMDAAKTAPKRRGTLATPATEAARKGSSGRKRA